jgi:hypothetical protein
MDAGADDETSVACHRLWGRALAHQQHQHEQQPEPPASALLRGGSSSTSSPNPSPNPQSCQKPFFGPWHFGSGDGNGNGRDEGVGPLGTSGEYATFKVRPSCSTRELNGKIQHNTPI